MAKSIIHNIVAKGSLDLFNTLLPILVTPYVYRVMGKFYMGSIEYMITLFTYFSMLGMLGIYNYGLRSISSNRNNIDKVRYVYKNLFVIGLISNTIFIVAYIVFLYCFVSNPIVKTLGFIYCGNLIAQLFYVEWVNEGFEEFKFITIKTVIIRSLSVIAIFTLVKNESDAILYVIIQSSVCIINYLVSFVYAQKRIRLSIREIFTDLHLREFIGPLLIILVLKNTGILYTVTDRTMLGYFTGTDNVALFSIGQKIVEICKTLVLSVVFATLPRLALYLKDEPEKYQEGLNRIMRLVIALIVPVGMGLFLLSKDVIWLFGGDQFLGGVMAMRIFSLRVIFLAVESILYNQILFLHGKEKIILKYNLLCGVLNVLLNFIIYHHLTPATAVFTTWISEIVFETLMILYIRNNIPIKIGLFKLYNLKYVILSLLFIPFVWIINKFNMPQFISMITSMTICSLFYLSALYLSKDTLLVDIFKRFRKI